MTDATKDALDALCATHVMGYIVERYAPFPEVGGTPVYRDGVVYLRKEDGLPDRRIWSPTRDGNAMLEVIERMGETHKSLRLHRSLVDTRPDSYLAIFCKKPWSPRSPMEDEDWSESDEAPVAVVLAALRALSVPIPEGV